jgi:hypothetical protein
MLWAYLSFSQYIIIWSGNLPEEIPWYLRRSRGGWQWIAVALALFHFAIPFFLLLVRRYKRRRQVISGNRRRRGCDAVGRSDVAGCPST